MTSEETVLNPYVIITPRNKLSAYGFWASLPPYRLRSIVECKPVFLKKENIMSAQINKSVWTIMTSNDDYDEIVIHAHQDEVQGGFEKHGPPPTSWLKLMRLYVIRSPSFLTLALIMVLLNIGFQIARHFKSEEFLNHYPLYHQYPKELLLIVKSRLVLWCVLVPSTLSPFVVALFSLSGVWKSKLGRIQAGVKVESWLMLIIGLVMLYNFPIVKFIKSTDTLFAPLNSPKIEKIIQDQQVHKNL